MLKQMFVLAWLSAVAMGATAQKLVISTSLGKIVVELYPEKAPITVSNFLKYVDAGKYDNGSFYRAVRLENQQASPIKIQVIQGGVKDDTTGLLPPIEIETTEKTGLRHKNGSLSMARSSPNSARTEFFICLNEDQPQLDYGGKRNPDGYGFAVFGQVIKGMKVVRKIQQQKTTLYPALKQPQLLVNPITIYSIKRK